MINKIFCIGFNKTGTSSMHRLFMSLGLSSWHGYYSHLPVTDPIFHQFQCFSDGDLHDFELLDKTFPRSKFILTTRPLSDWLVSRIRHIEHRRSVGATGPMREEYEANPELAVRLWIEQRLRYHERVQHYFKERESDLLIIDICNSKTAASCIREIIEFLEQPERPELSMPHENANSADLKAPSSRVREKSQVLDEVMVAFRALRLDPDKYNSSFP